MWSQAPEASSKSPSLDTMLREQVKPFRPARTSAQIMPMGVRDIAVVHERSRFFERDDLGTQAPITA
jgi:hypothetical protein